MEDAELLIQEAHRRGLRIILDIALNHTSAEVSEPRSMEKEMIFNWS